MNRKKKKHSGWTESNSTIKNKKRFIIQNCLEPHFYYDDWNDHRDGFRDWFSDFKKIKKVKKHSRIWSDRIEKRINMNQKQKMFLKRRKVKKNKKKQI